jgi:hypothetical protein
VIEVMNITHRPLKVKKISAILVSEEGTVHSGVEWIGVEWIGVEWIGVEWIGVEWIGVKWNE